MINTLRSDGKKTLPFLAGKCWKNTKNVVEPFPDANIGHTMLETGLYWF